MLYSITRNQGVNSSPPSATYMRHWIGTTLVQIMACRLFGAKPLSKITLDYFNRTLRNKLQWNFTQNKKLFIDENASENIVCKMAAILSRGRWVNTLRPEQNGIRFVDDIFYHVLMKQNYCILIQVSLDCYIYFKTANKIILCDYDSVNCTIWLVCLFSLIQETNMLSLILLHIIVFYIWQPKLTSSVAMDIYEAVDSVLPQ